MTKFKPLSDSRRTIKEEYVDVKRSQEEALKVFKNMFPHMRGRIEDNTLVSDTNNTYFLRIHEVEV